MIGRALPYVAAAVTAAGLIAGGLVLAASAESPTVVLPRFPDDPELAWDVRVDDAEWAVGDADNIYVAAPPVVDGWTIVTVWDRATGEFVRELNTESPAGESAAFSEIVDGVLLAERCTFSDNVDSACELVAIDAARGRTLWNEDTSATAVGLNDGFVVLATPGLLRLLDLRSGELQSSVSGEAVLFDSLRSEFTVRDGVDVEVFRLPEVEQPIASARLPSADAVFDVVGHTLVVGNDRRLSFAGDEGLKEGRTFPADIESVLAGSDELVLVAAEDGETLAVDISAIGSPTIAWTTSAENIVGLVSDAGSVIVDYDSEIVDGEDNDRYLDQSSGRVIVASDFGLWEFADRGLVIVEADRVWGFGYDEQDEVWSVDGVAGLRGDATVHLVDGGFVVIEADGTVRLYQ